MVTSQPVVLLTLVHNEFPTLRNLLLRPNNWLISSFKLIYCTFTLFCEHSINVIFGFKAFKQSKVEHTLYDLVFLRMFRDDNQTGPRLTMLGSYQSP